MAKNGKAETVDVGQLMRDALANKQRFVEQAQQELAKFDGQIMGMFLASGMSPEQANEELGQAYFQINDSTEEPISEPA